MAGNQRLPSEVDIQEAHHGVNELNCFGDNGQQLGGAGDEGKLRENLNAIGFGVKWFPIFGDNEQVLSRMVSDKPWDMLGAKQISVLTKQLQEAASDGFENVWPFYANTHKNVADIMTKGSLKGKDAAKFETRLQS